MKNRSVFIGIFLILFTSNVFGLIIIPDTPDARWKRAVQLEKQLAGQSDQDKQIELAVLYAVIAGKDKMDKSTTLKAEKLLRAASKANPRNYILMVTHGSVLTMLAKYETHTGKKLAFVKRGTRKMDRAVRKSPDDVDVLLQRANNSIRLPAFLNRLHLAQKDFEKILKLEGDKRGDRFKAMILYQLGNIYQLSEKENVAVKYWKQAVSLNTPYWSEKAREKLD